MSHPQPVNPNSERDPADTTPLDAARWQRLLVGHPDRDFASYVSRGLKFGFDIGHRGHRPALTARNLRSAFEHADFVDAHLEQSIAAGHTAGPFSSPPFPSMCCSGVGVVPKKSGKLRLIHHLSAPAGVSVNDGIPKDLYSLQYVTIDDAINMILRLGRGTLLAKIDIRNAFRLCPVRPEDRPLLGIYWRQQYYYDLVLPFGLRSAPFIFNQVADAFQWICREEFGISDLIHLLDDFLTAGPPASDICSRRLEIILAACTYLGIPVAEEKTEASTTSLTFLGIHLDTDLLEARLPDDKLAELRDLLVMFFWPAIMYQAGPIEPVRQTEFCRLGRRGRSHIHAPLVGCHSCRTRATLPHYSQRVVPRRFGVVALPPGHLERAVVLPPAWLVASPSYAPLYRCLRNAWLRRLS